MLNMEVAVDWVKCMDTCSKYRRAMAPSFSDENSLQQLKAWSNKVSVDPSTSAFYPDVKSNVFWLAYRYQEYWMSFTLQMEYKQRHV